LEFQAEAICKQVIERCLDQGLFTDWFLFAPHCMRIAPPLTITEHEIAAACTILQKVMNEVAEKS